MLGLALILRPSSHRPGLIVSPRSGASTRLARNRCVHCARTWQIVFQEIAYGSLSPRLSIFEIIEEGLIIQKPEWSARAAPCARRSKRLKEVGERRSRLHRPAIRTSSRRPAPAHGARHRHGRSSRAPSCWTSRPAPRHERAGTRLWIYCGICRPSGDLAYLFNLSHDLKVVRALVQLRQCDERTARWSRKARAGPDRTQGRPACPARSRI